MTLSQVDTGVAEINLLLKSQSGSWTGGGVLEVYYDADNGLAQVWSYTTQQDWVQHGSDIPVTFTNGDRFGAVATSSGEVKVYKNSTLVGTVDVTGHPSGCTRGVAVLCQRRVYRAVDDQCQRYEAGRLRRRDDSGRQRARVEPGDGVRTGQGVVQEPDWQGQGALIPVAVEARSLAVEVPVGQVWKNYILAGGQRVAMREYTSTNPTGTVYFLLGDHLGSTSVVTNAATGVVVSQIWYSAYVEERYTSGMTPTDYRYTGQLSRMVEIGLYHYGARWFDPALAHFVQADTVVPDASNPATFDRFAYTRNNPIRYNDPTGHDVGCPASNPACTKLSGYGNEDRAKAYDEYVEKYRQMYRVHLQRTMPNFLVTPQTGSNLFPGTPNPQAEAQKIPLKCSVEKPRPSISSWTPPEEWDLDPSHPDYKVSTLALGPATFSYTVDRYGGEYIGAGPNIGKGFPVSFSHNNGFIKAVDGMMPMQSDVESFLTGTSLSVNAGAIVDVTTTWSPFAGDRVAHSAGEYGAFIGISIGISVNIYNFKLP